MPGSRRSLKVAHVVPFYHPVIGGMEALVRFTAGFLIERGHRVDVLTCDIDHKGHRLERPDRETMDGVNVFRFRAILKTGFMTVFPGFVGQLRSGRYDVIHLHAYRHFHTEAGSRAARKLGVPSILHGHGPFYPKGIRFSKRLFYDLYDRWASASVFKNVDAIFASTEIDKREYVRRGADESKISVVHSGIPDSYFAGAEAVPFTERHGLRGKKIVLSVGRLHENKRVDALIRGFAAIAAEEPDAVLVLVGPDGGVYSYLDALARSLGISDRLRWLGSLPHEEVLASYQACRVFAMLSDYEPFGLVLVEAMAASKPVLAVNAGGPTEIVDPDKTGFLVPPGDSEAVSRRLLQLLRDPELAASMGRAGRERAERFRLKNITGTIEEHYYRLLEGRTV